MGFAQGVSGLNASSSNLDVIGNNIANSGTTGFKVGTTQFADVYAGSQVGLGVQVAAVTQNFSQGAVTSNGVGTDVAITGNGFFQMTSPTGQMWYSRDGAFTQNSSGYLVDSAGFQVTGYQVGANGAIAGGTPSALKLPISTPMTPNATTQINAKFNLNSSDPIPATTTFSPTDPTSFNYSNTVTAYDSLGNTHQIASFFVNTSPGNWDVYQTSDGQLVGGTTPTPVGSLVFDSSGTLTSGSPLATVTVTSATSAADMAYTLNLTGTTQYGSADAIVSAATQNGYTSGQLTSFAINSDGTVTGRYSNNQTNTLGQIVLASFANPSGLVNASGNLLTATPASGGPLITAPGVGTSAGSLTSGALEASNVDLTSELVNLIIAQRTYQANAQTIKTQDQILQTLVTGL